MTDRTHRRLETAHSTLRVTAAALAVVMLLVSALSVPVAAQTDGGNETDPCAFGPPVPGQDADDEEVADLEVALVSDRSGSMTVNNRSQILKNASTAFVSRLDDADEAAAVSWAATATLDQQLTTDHQAVINAIEAIQANETGENLDGGITIAKDELINGTNASDGANKVMVISTDAAPGNFGDAVNNTVQAAKDANITVATVAIGEDADHDSIQQLASGDLYYNASDPDTLDDIFTEISRDVGAVSGGLRIDTRDLFKPGATHSYTVTNVTYVTDPETGETETLRSDVTDQANLTSSNTSLLTVDENNTQLVATDDANTSTWVRVDATTANNTGCTNVIVSQPTLENLELVPGIWRVSAVAGDSTLFALLIATLLAVPAARFTSAFGGLAVGQMVLVVGWFAGYVSFGMAAVSLFVALFIGLNLAANIDYTGGRLPR